MTARLKRPLKRSLKHNTLSALLLILTPLFTPLVSVAAPVDPLGALLQRAQKGSDALRDPHAEASASVSLVLLLKEPLSEEQAQAPTRKALNAALKRAQSLLHNAQAAKALTPKALIKGLSITSLKVDEAFPLNINALTASARDEALSAQALTQKGALIVSYRGGALKGGAQLGLTCEAARGALSTLSTEAQASVLIFSLESLSHLTTEALEARCELSSPSKLNIEGLKPLVASWVRPDIEALEGGQLRFVSRGRAQFGRAELELGPLSQTEARPLWPLFVNEVLSSGRAPHNTQRFTRGDCLRPEHAYEGRCARLIPRVNGAPREPSK